jgi:hypothetical protein
LVARQRDCKVRHLPSHIIHGCGVLRNGGCEIIVGRLICRILLRVLLQRELQERLRTQLRGLLLLRLVGRLHRVLLRR